MGKEGRQLVCSFFQIHYTDTLCINLNFKLYFMLAQSTNIELFHKPVRNEKILTLRFELYQMLHWQVRLKAGKDSELRKVTFLFPRSPSKYVSCAYHSSNIHTSYWRTLNLHPFTWPCLQAQMLRLWWGGGGVWGVGG